MTQGMILKTVLEFGLIVFTLWALLHEDKFAAVEQRLFAYLRRRKFKVVRGRNFEQTYPVRNR